MPSRRERPDEPLDGRPAPDLDDRLPQAAGVGEPPARRRGPAGPRPRLAAGPALHPLRGRGRRAARAARSATWSAAAPRGRRWPTWSAARSSIRCLTVSPAVLIPRPDSEFVVVEFLDAAKGVESPRVVDVGTGSGCLALACAHQHKSARFVAIDLSPEALAVAADERRDARPGRPGRVPPGRPARAGRRRGPVRRDRLEPALHPDRRHPDARAGRPRLRAAPGPRRRRRRPPRGRPADRPRRSRCSSRAAT